MALLFDENVTALWVGFLIVALICLMVITVCVYRIYSVLSIETLAPLRKTVVGRPFMY